jgi:mycothiol synthase
MHAQGMGFELRPARRDDLAGICALINRAEAHDDVPRVLSLAELEEDLASPHLSLDHDTRVAVADGEIVGWTYLYHPPALARMDRVFLIGDVDPDHRKQGIGRALLGWSLDRARDRLAEREHDLPRIVRVDSYEWQESRLRLFARFGFTAVRWFEDLLRPLDDIPGVPTPDAITLVPWPADREAELLRVRNEGFDDHWGSSPVDEERWHALIHGHGARPDLSVIAVSAETDEVVGVCLNHAYPEDFELIGRKEGWITNISTIRPWRGRGVASAMLGWSMAAFAEAGFTHAALSVDSDSPTGAARLYRNLGFEPVRRTITYQIELEQPSVAS